jgi:hypothetical protein
VHQRRRGKSNNLENLQAIPFKFENVLNKLKTQMALVFN